ncbi:chea signal transduction histidine kinase [Heliomicrobium modesticaldum Ice1]|uniref:Chemotaxis protein CheA n=2 Tax=Heliomicrobium modesticaldum TaxID=35701 RepID=B0TC94_HELMI|nr:chea signal transduction histidine kinase [Heliomicrobium modesticaldum Ice1]
MDQYMDLFYSEAKEQLDILTRDLLAIESGSSSQEMIHEMFRAAHTLKGSSAMVGFPAVTEMTHKVEDLLGKVREGKHILSAKDIDLVFQALDYIQNCLFHPEAVDSAKTEELARKLADIQDQPAPANGPADDSVAKRTAQLAELRSRGTYKGKATEILVTFRPECAMRSVRFFLILNNLKEFGEVIGSVPAWSEMEANENAYEEASILLDWRQGSRNDLERALNVADVRCIEIRSGDDGNEAFSAVGAAEPPTALPAATEVTVAKAAAGYRGTEAVKTPAADLASQGDSSHRPTEYIKIEANRLDLLMNLIGEMLISQARFSRIQENYLERHGQTPLAVEMAEETHQLARITTQLQDGLMKARLVPIGGVFSRFPRIVRDLARKQGKKVNLMMEGQDTELDKTVVDLIGDPIMHLIRNSVDHGIELPEARRQAGKPEEGTIRLKATHEGSRIVVEIGDDGRGIDESKVLAKGRALGLIPEGQTPSRQEILDLIFAPGFSTAEKVTDISGRGVGMDVVKRAISSLHGIIDIQSEPGQGTAFQLQLPITLAIIQGLIVRVERESLIIPLDNVLESFQLQNKEVQSVGGREVFSVRGRIVPLYRLQDLLQIPLDPEKGRRKYRSVVMVGLAERRMGLEVDSLIGKKEIVIKPIKAPWLNLEHFAGATILGDGRVSLILNIGAIFRRGAGERLQN